jgi:integrase
MLLSEAVDRYLADRANKGYAPSTVRSDGRILRRLLADVGNIQVSSLTHQHMDLFWARRSNEWGPGTFNLARTIVGTFFKWCQTRGILSRSTDLLEGVRARKVPARSRLIVPSEEFPTLLDAADDPRDRAMIALGLYLFTRISETVNLKWKDIDFQNHTVSVFRIKTQTLDVLPMCEELEHELKVWRLEYASLMGEVAKPGWTVVPPYANRHWVGVPGKRGVLQPVGDRTLRPTGCLTSGTKIIQRVLEAAGYTFDKLEGGHTLRRSGATALYNELSARGHDKAIRMCQAMLGHASIQTTEVYLALSLDRKARNDLLAGKRMFAGSGQEAAVLELGAADG